ncbi:MAG: acetoin dehydrogenase dihydrolipoyllysine-residue acetyltransferase subunit [Alphaproteobacteria bacterium]
MSDDIRAIVMPKWGLAMTEGMVVEWTIELGASFNRGDEIADIETAKIANALEASTSGIMRRIVVAPDETVPVGALLAVAAPTSVSDGDIDAYVADFQANFVVEETEEDTGPAFELAEISGGRKIQYLRQGPDNGPTIVLVHGFGADLNSWMFNQPALSEQFQVIAMDLPGHGGSSKDVGGGHVAAMAQAVLEFLDAVNLTSAHLVGHSLGGACALHLALSQPNRVASASLICPAGLGHEINMDFINSFIDARRPRQLRATLEMLFHESGLVSREMIDAVLKFKRLDGVPEALAAIAEAAFTEGRQSDVMTDRMGELTVPVQVIWGASDQIVPMPDGLETLAALTIHRLEEIGHTAHMEAPGRVNPLVADFVAAASG